MTALKRNVKRFILFAALVYFVTLFFRVIGGLPGASSSSARREGLQFKQDLQLEIPGLAPDSYDIFGRGVKLQVRGKYDEALDEYNKLKFAKTDDGQIVNLWNSSDSVQHNIQLLESRRRQR